MIFQGQEFWRMVGFKTPIRWTGTRRLNFGGLVQLYQDLIRLRLNKDGMTKGD